MLAMMFVVAGCVAASIDDAIKYTQRKRESERDMKRQTKMAPCSVVVVDGAVVGVKCLLLCRCAMLRF